VAVAAAAAAAAAAAVFLSGAHALRSAQKSKFHEIFHEKLCLLKTIFYFCGSNWKEKIGSDRSHW
jgi:hypothetical protein